jgi:hypothetical protein
MAPYYAAGNGCDGPGSAGRALGRGGLRQRKQGSSGEPGISYLRFHLGFPFEIASMCEVGSHLLEPRWAGFVYAKSAGSLSFT